MRQILRTKKMKVKYFSKLSEYWTLNTRYCSVALSTAVLLLSGCMGVYEGGFECPPGEGIKCKSISEVNQTVNHWADQSSILRNEMSEDGDEERKSRAEKASVCQRHGSCSAVSNIWYSPFFKNNQQEKKKSKVFNVPISI